MQRTSVAFGRFRLLPHLRELLSDDRPIKLGGRAFEVLLALIETPGAVVPKDVLMARVWADRVVEENNLHAQITTLRKAFGSERGLIRTVAGRGYQFTGDVRELSAGPSSAVRPIVAPSASVLPLTNVPEAVSELIGREEELSEILNLATEHRLVTLTGAGGIGKTALALVLARELRPHSADGVWLAEFSGLADPALVPAAVAAALGLELGGGEASVQRVAQALANRRLLLVLDTCEHVIDDAAAFAEVLLRTSPTLHIIATSREPLRAEGEWVYALRPLAVPLDDAADDDQPLRYGAVRLFIERARAAGAHFASDRNLMTTIAAICRRLDGIPLAIELAAARVAALGVDEVARRLDDRLGLMSGGRRTALPRHQTLRATLDWSYALLTEPERVILRRLAVFAGPFGLQAATAVAANPENAPSEVADGLSSLLAKSLVTVDAGGSIRRYRLLDTTRAYALEKLTESGERDTLARCHAAYYQDLFEHAGAEWESRPAAEWLADYGREIDNLRAALDWAFADPGDASIGVASTAAAVPLWVQLSLLTECRGWVDRALDALARSGKPDRSREMFLQAARASALLGTAGTVDAVGSAWNRALELAEELDDLDQQLRALYGLFLYHFRVGEYRKGLTCAHRFRAAAQKKADPSDLLQADRIVGVSLFLLGDPRGARERIERLLARSPAIRSRLQAVRFGLDQRVAALFHLARILWVQGFPDQAISTAAAGVDEAVALDHTTSLCFALADGACLVSAWVGDDAATTRYVTMLIERGEKFGLRVWHAHTLAWRGWLREREGDRETAIALMGAAIAEFRETQFDFHFTTFLASFAEILARGGQIADAAAAIEEAVRRATASEELWCMPELLHIRGNITRLQGHPDGTRIATDLYEQALDWARRQGALSWELRTATSLARLLQDQSRSADALTLLQSVYDRFTEGFATADLRAAKTLLDAL